MDTRELFENREKKYYSPYATLSSKTRGRLKEEEPSPFLTEFQKDTFKILHSMSFRLLKHKTQVFLSTIGDKFRTRLTHTLEVSSVARIIANGLDLNQDLVEAIAIGHDLGHTPFGHMGEFALNELTPFEFRHHEQSVRVVTRLENSGSGLNLTREVVEGILGHSKGESTIKEITEENKAGKSRTTTIEGEVVQLSDWIAYINHDLDDAFNMGLITQDDIPKGTEEILGYNFEQRISTMVMNIIESSRDQAHISMSDDIMEASDNLRGFLYRNVYTLPAIKEKESTAREVIRSLFDFFMENYDLIIKEMPFLENNKKERGVCDYLASLSDFKAQSLYEKNIK